MTQKDHLQTCLAAGSEEVDSSESCSHHWEHWFYHPLS